MGAISVLTCALVLLGTGELFAAECKERSTGKPIYREERGPLRPPPEGEPSPVPVVTFEIYATGTWRWVESGEAGSGEALGRSGCAAPAVMRELVRLVGRARFEIVRTPGVCDAVPTMRIVYSAPRRRRTVASEEPCGQPVDELTRQLASCASSLMGSPRAADQIARCRGRAP